MNIMELVTGLYAFAIETEFALGAWQVVIIVIFMSFCLLLGKHRLGLVVSYVLIFIWGYVLNYSTFSAMLNDTEYGYIIYVLSGLFMLVMTVVGMIKEKSED